MEKKVTIRKAEKSDAEMIWQCNCEGLGYTFALEDTIRRVHDIMDRFPQDLFLVACVGDQPAGYIHATDYECTYMEAYKDIEELAVLPGYQGYGIGRKLLNEAEAWARESGVAGVRLISGFARTGAHQFYLKCGYTHRKDHKNFVKNF